MDIDVPLEMIMALNDGWIYVDNDEILPQHDDLLLVTVEKGDERWTGIAVFDKREGWGLLHTATVTHPRVIAWRPMPEPAGPEVQLV